MASYTLYLANTNGRKISGFETIEAETFAEARAIFRAACDKKGIDRASTEILGVLK